MSLKSILGPLRSVDVFGRVHYEELKHLCSATALANQPTYLPISIEEEGGNSVTPPLVFTHTHTHNHNFKGTRASWHHHPTHQLPPYSSPRSPWTFDAFLFLRIQGTEPTLFWITRTNVAAILLSSSLQQEQQLSFEDDRSAGYCTN